MEKLLCCVFSTYSCCPAELGTWWSPSAGLSDRADPGTRPAPGRRSRYCTSPPLCSDPLYSTGRPLCAGNSAATQPNTDYISLVSYTVSRTASATEASSFFKEGLWVIQIVYEKLWLKLHTTRAKSISQACKHMKSWIKRSSLHSSGSGRFIF